MRRCEPYVCEDLGMRGQLPLRIVNAIIFTLSAVGCFGTGPTTVDVDDEREVRLSSGQTELVLWDLLNYGGWVRSAVDTELGTERPTYRLATCRTMWSAACVDFPREIGGGCSVDHCAQLDWVAGLYSPYDDWGIMAVGLWPDEAQAYGFENCVSAVAVVSVEAHGGWYPVEDSFNGGDYNRAVWIVLANALADLPSTTLPNLLVEESRTHSQVDE